MSRQYCGICGCELMPDEVLHGICVSCYDDYRELDLYRGEDIEDDGETLNPEDDSERVL